jgi:eukaryotic-like serine/threonine-protein kinase
MDIARQTWLDDATLVKKVASQRLKTANTITSDGRSHRAAAVSLPGPPGGELFGRYQYVTQVGVGGGGSVHLVKDTVLLRQVALKILDAAQGEKPRQSRRFLHEAQITAQLDHPNIVPVHDLATGPAYYTMKLVRGTTLADWIVTSSGSGRSPAVLNDMIGVLLKVCDALAFAHSRGILHCDLKPTNIMVGDFGEVYLMDWGSARMLPRTRVSISGAAVEGKAGRMIGTPAYMAPEQLAGQHDKLDQRTDVFGLGAVLYAILTGRAPFDAESLGQTVRQARAGRLSFAMSDPMSIPPALEAITRRAMSRKPAERHATILDLKRELEAFVKGGYDLPTRTYSAGAPIIKEGERGSEVFIIEKGTCLVSKRIGGVEKVLREMHVGTVFGETAALAGGLRTATVTAVDEVTVRIVSKKILDEYLGPNTWISTLVVALAQRFRAADERITQLESQNG